MRAQCCICSDLFVSNETNIAATQCGHVFHEHCLARWLISSKTCPSCRKKVVESAVIPKLYFDIAEEEAEEADPEQISNELHSLRTQVTELKHEKSTHKAKEKELRDKLKKKEEELENVSLLLRREQETGTAQQRMLQHYEVQQQIYKEEKAEFLRTKRKLTEFKHVDTLISGSSSDCEELMQQYASGDRSSILQLIKYAAILKREYEQIKGEKRAIKEQLEMHKKNSYTATRGLSEMKTSHKLLQEQLSRSEEELKQAEKTNAALKAKVNKLQYSRKHPAETSGSFIETPKNLNLSDNASVETPKLSFDANASTSSFVTPKLARPAGPSRIDSERDILNQSFDLFEDSPRTEVRKSCEENNMKVVKISSAATSSKASKRVRADADEVDSFPLATLNIMKKREKTGLLGSSVIRKDYNGLGGTSSFTQPLGAPKYGGLKLSSKARKTIKVVRKGAHPLLPTLDGYVDLT